MRADQDRRAGPVRSRREVQPAAAHRRGTRRGCRLPRWPGPGARSPHMTGVPWTRAAVLRLAVASLVLIGALFLFVFPTTAVMDQRGQLSDAEQRLSVLK